MLTVNANFTDVGNGDQLQVDHGDSFSYAVTGTFVGTWILERTINRGASWEEIATGTGTGSGTVKHESPGREAGHFRFRCSAYTSGTIETALSEVAAVVQDFQDRHGNVIFRIKEDGVQVTGTQSVTGALTPGGVTRTGQKRIIPAGSLGKVGATAGWAPAAGDNVNLATCPASQSGATLVIPIPGLKVGDTIKSFHLIGQIESAGGSVTVDADLRKQTAAAADVTDASIGAITQLSVTADTIMSASNAAKTLATPEVVGADETFYLLVTVTTAASTDVALQGVAVVVDEA